MIRCWSQGEIGWVWLAIILGFQPSVVCQNLTLFQVSHNERILQLGTPFEHVFLELRIDPGEGQPGDIVLQFFDTRGVDWRNFHGGCEVTDNRQTNGYWVLGDVTAVRTILSFTLSL